MSSPYETVTVGGITAKIATDAPFRFGIDQRGPARTVTYQLEDLSGAAARGPEFCDALMGVGAYGGGIFGFPIPHRYPNNTNLVCMQVQLGEFLGAKQPDRQLMGSSCLTIVADYGTPQFDVLGTDNQVFTDDIAVPWSSLVAKGGYEEHRAEDLTSETSAILMTKGVKIRVPIIDYIYRRSMIPDLFNYDNLLSGLVGKINNATFFGKAIGTVMLEDWDLSDDWDASGRRVREFEMILRWRAQDWNKVLLPGFSRTWDYVEDSGGDRPLEYADFSTILRYGLA